MIPVASWALGGLLATLVLTTVMAVAQGLGLTRMSIPTLLGAIFTHDRDRALLIGFFVHLVDGWIFAFLYLLAFRTWHIGSPLVGAGLGLVHAAFVLTVGMELVSVLHPRMATERHGPTVVRQWEPPGFFALHYGVQTPIVVLIAHALYGAILGAVS